MSTTLIWTIVLVIAVIVEAITIDLVSIWFGIGAIGALICDFLGIHEVVQVIVFAVISIICILITRPLAKKYLRGNTVKTNLDRMIGKHCLVTEMITADQKGEVKVMGNLWAATSLNNVIIPAGEYAEVVSIEGSHVVVKKLDKGEDISC